MSDYISHPDHYCEGRRYEPKDVIRDWGLNYNLGCAVKYISRAGRKDDILMDLKKARQYLEFEIEALEEEATGTHGLAAYYYAKDENADMAAEVVAGKKNKLKDYISAGCVIYHDPGCKYKATMDELSEILKGEKEE